MDLDLEELESRLVIPAPNGRPGLVLGWLATVFFENPWTRPVREAVAELGEHYIEQFREHLVWAQHTKTARMYPMAKNRVPTPGQWLPQHEDGESWWFGFHGGEKEDDASAFQVCALGSDDVVKDLGYFHVRLPLLWFKSHPGSFPEFVRPICQKLRPASGRAGIGFLLPLSVEGQIHGEALVTPLASRFPGIEVDSPTSDCFQLHDGIRGVNWLTILGDRWVEAAGGRDYLRIRLDEPTFPFYPYDGGLMIQAGPKPQIGDTTRGLWPEHYVTLHKVLKKIQIKTYTRFHMGGPGPRMDQPATLAWLFRFDGR
ncbi:MAG TPA: type VI immunity family protein [Polyangium sp.]|jgi:hypothetical protein|nr:type VI immunity family protein [Polyangium sp.]